MSHEALADAKSASDSSGIQFGVRQEYLGSPNWPALLLSLSNGSSSFTHVDGELRSSDLEVGQVVEISYLPNRKIRFAYLGDEKFEIVAKENSKLQKGDVCTISSFIVRYPLIIRNVVRRNTALGSYSAARAGGITTVKILK